MARDGSGGYSLPNGTYTPNTLADADEVTADFADITTAIAGSMAKDGQTTATGNMKWGGYRQTNVGDATAHTDAPNAGQVQDQSFTWCGTAGGTKNALTLSPSPAITAYAGGQRFRFIVGGTASDDAVTVAISGLTTKAIEIDGSALSASVVLEAGKLYEIDYDGTAFQASRLSVSTNSPPDDSTIEDASSTLRVKDAGITLAKLADAAKTYDGTIYAGYDADFVKADLEVKVYAKYLATRDFTFTSILAAIETAPTGQALIIDVKINGTTVYSSLPQFAATSTTLTAGTVKTDGTEDVSAGDTITVEVTQIGSSEPGEGLLVAVLGTLA